MNGTHQFGVRPVEALCHRRLSGQRLTLTRFARIRMFLVSVAFLVTTITVHFFVDGLMVQRVDKRDKLIHRLESLSVRVHVYNASIAQYQAEKYQSMHDKGTADIRIRWMGLLEEKLRTHELDRTEYSFLEPVQVVLDLPSKNQLFELLEYTLVITGNERHAVPLISLLDDLLGGGHDWVESRGCALARTQNQNASVRFRCQLSFYSLVVVNEENTRGFTD